MRASEDFRIVTLKIDGIKLDAVGLEEIGDYLRDFSQLIGPDADPRFHAIRRGSVKLQAIVNREKEIEVKNRAFLIRTGDAPEEAIRAKDRIAHRMSVHRAKRATLIDSSNTRVIEIPVAEAKQIEQIEGLPRVGSVQGKIIRIGGKNDIVPVDIQDVDGHVYGCRARRDKARELAREMFGPTIRANGVGKWLRDQDGAWHVTEFLITEFEVLEDDSFLSVIEALRQIPSDWKNLDDPDLALRKIQRGVRDS